MGFKEEGTKKILNLDQWLSAFFIFSAIYLQRYPNESEALLMYVETVRRLEKKGGNWRYYDEQFRKLKKPLGLHWNDNHQALWLDARLDQIQSPKQSMQSQNLVPNGYCQKYHAGNTCRYPCRYNHRCFKCGMFHPSVYPCQSSNQTSMNAIPQVNRFNTPRIPSSGEYRSHTDLNPHFGPMLPPQNGRFFRPQFRGSRP